MKMYVSDLREGDRFDADEFVSRKNLWLREPTRKPVVVTSVNSDMDCFTAITFHAEAANRTYRWTLEKDDMVEVEGW